MAALLRQAARRLVGVQRTPAVANAEERRRLLSRLLHTNERASILRQIQEKKQDLYDLISLTENSVHTNSQNRELLRSLSAQIQPRPHDPEWCMLRAAKRRSDVIRPAGIIMGFCIGLFAVLLMRGLDAARMEEINKKNEEIDAVKENEVALV